MANCHYAVWVEEKQRPPSVDADKYIIRFPEGMRAQLHEAARANNRTLNAEIVARLQASFSPSSESRPDFRPALELQMATVQLRVEMINTRAEVLQQRVQLLKGRHADLADQVAYYAPRAKTDEDMVWLDSKIEEMRAIDEEDAPKLAREMDQLDEQRSALVAEMDRMQALLGSVVGALEQSMAAYRERQPARAGTDGPVIPPFLHKEPAQPVVHEERKDYAVGSAAKSAGGDDISLMVRGIPMKLVREGKEGFRPAKPATKTEGKTIKAQVKAQGRGKRG